MPLPNSFDRSDCEAAEISDGKYDKADYERTVKTLLTGGSDPVISKEPVGA